MSVRQFRRLAFASSGGFHARISKSQKPLCFLRYLLFKFLPSFPSVRRRLRSQPEEFGFS